MDRHEDYWRSVYNVLIEECGAPDTDSMWQQFIAYMNHGAEESFGWEFRFIGHLGFGGKFHRAPHRGHMRVSCYYEDETPKRRAMIDAANKRLIVLEESLPKE